jgi:hypothetical protein
VAFAVSRINVKWSTAASHNICARIQVTGIKPDYRKRLSLGLGTTVRCMMEWII